MLALRWNSRKDRYFVTAENGRILGEIIGKVYFTPRSVQHFSVKFQGFGLSEGVIEELLALGVHFVVFDYFGKLGRTTYRCELLDLVVNGELWVDESWGKPDKQLVMPIKRMEVLKGKS